MKIKRMLVSEFQTNCYVVYNQKQETLIIDPGDNAKKIKKFIDEKHLEVKAVLLTHGHCDHIGATDLLYETYRCPIYLHQEDHIYLNRPQYNLSYMIQKDLKISSPVLNAPQLLEIGDYQIRFHHLPGHTPGSCMIEFEKENVIFSGDVLFKQGIGRYDFPLSSKHDTYQTIQKLLAFDHDAKVFPGHGEITSIKEEQQNNPFLSM